MINNENFSDMIDAMKESDTWSQTLAEQVGEIAAASFCFGSGLLFDLIKGSMRDAIDYPNGTTLSDINYNVLIFGYKFVRGTCISL